MDYCRGKETILVVDDEESLRTVIVDLLGHLGYCTLSAANAHDAMKLALEYPGKIDLLLTDMVQRREVALAAQYIHDLAGRSAREPRRERRSRARTAGVRTTRPEPKGA